MMQRNISIALIIANIIMGIICCSFLTIGMFMIGVLNFAAAFLNIGIMYVDKKING
jgi:hypothetical protein